MHTAAERVILMFLVIFAITAIGDVWTTELGRRLPNTVELNPAGFQPLLTSILVEFAVGAVGILLVVLGTRIVADTLSSAKGASFFEFVSQLQGRFPSFLLVFAPIAIAELRVVAIASNFSILVWGDSPLNEFVLDNIAGWTGLPDSRALPIMFAAIALVAYLPIMWTIYLVAKRGASHPEPSVDRARAITPIV